MARFAPEYPASRCVFDLDGKAAELARLEKRAADPAMWVDNRKAQTAMRRMAALKAELDAWASLTRRADELDELTSLAIDEADDSLAETMREDLAGLSADLERMELSLMLSGEYDDRNAILALHAGAGGADSQDWTRMLMRMYVRWAERSGFDTEILDLSAGEDAGVKRAVVQINGANAYGYLRAEKGVHRLVRISPFDNTRARHTSFALAEAMPEVEEGEDVSVSPDDLRIDTFRAGGHGGQSVQKNSTAVRITHLPTGTRVVCQNERSQHQNREIAMRILIARLAEMEMRRRAEEMAKLKGEHISPEWGNQIRSYVLHPYQMVRDHRTGCKTSDADAALDGDLDEFIIAYLKSTVGDGDR